MARILVIDDEVSLVATLMKLLRQSGHQADAAFTLTDGLERGREEEYDIIFLDVMLPDGNGLEHLAELQASPSNPEVIIITGQGEQDGAKKAILSGAWAYINKPDLAQDLVLHVTRALQYRDEKRKLEKLPVVLKRENIIGNSPQLKQCLEHVSQAAQSDASVLLTGETGTGKELFAKAIHENSKRADHDFIIVDCAALPENLIESTLFGHVKGAFTGAVTKRDGLVKLADKGTLFLDEIGELPLNIQKIFLRVLQEQSFRPVGSSREERSDFRIIAATNRNIEESVAQGIFRSDLLFRLQAFSIKLPPLRMREGDVVLLVRYFLERLCDRLQINPKGISPDFIEHLEAYDWPGNVRQLQQTLEQIFASAVQHPTLFARHLPEHFRIRQAQAGIPDREIENVSSGSVKELPPWTQYKMEFQCKYIHELMKISKGKVSKACQISKMSRSRLYLLRQKYDLLDLD